MIKHIPFILLCVLCFCLGVIYTVFHKKVGWKGIVLRGLTMLSILTLALVSANLKELSNALPLFISLGLSTIILQEVTLATDSVDEKAKKIVFSTFATVSNVLIAVSAITFAEFNYLAVVGGVLVGLGIGLIVCALRKYKDAYSIITESMVYASIGLYFGFAIMGILTATHLISSLLFLVGGGLMLLQSILRTTCSRWSITSYFVSAIYVLSLIVTTMVIYFF